MKNTTSTRATRSFLPSGGVITFTDTNGRLMALKPDVTLSIAKNLGGGPDSTPEKLYYDESVYRAPDSGLGFQEITQAGLEYLGPVDGYVMGEVAMLAARSLGEISPDWVLDLSHMGYLCALVDELGLRGPERAELLRAVGSRSAQAMRAVCTAAGAPEEPADRLIPPRGALRPGDGAAAGAARPGGDGGGAGRGG